ncbi:MAG: DUF1192 domain-containing protein [Oceanicaulis sp.]|nr:DUF1192 domain-containing protein [Oceanicaulis sp.]
MFHDEPHTEAAGVIRPGEDLSLLAVAELEARIETLQAEIARAEAMIAHKRDKLNAAEAVFRRA